MPAVTRSQKLGASGQQTAQKVARQVSKKAGVKQTKPAKKTRTRKTRTVQHPTEEPNTMGDKASYGHIIKPFTGNTAEEAQDAGVWLDKYLYAATDETWDDGVQFQKFPRHLEGTAWAWYQALPQTERKDFATLKQAFRRRFVPTEDTRILNV